MTQVRRFARQLAVPVFVLVVSVAYLSAAPPATAPLTGDWQMPAAGETAAVDGSLSVATSVSVVDGVTTVSYTCAATGHAKGKTSGAMFALAGAGSGSVPLTQSIHSDLPIVCVVSLTSEGTDQHYRIQLQTTVNDDGSAHSAVVRSVQPF